jgi:hypothetical protein
MGAKMEPLSGLETGSAAFAAASPGLQSSGGGIGATAHHHSLSFVKLELDSHHLHNHHHPSSAAVADKEDGGDAGGGGGKVEVKMEVLGELFGYGFGCDTSSLLGESESEGLTFGGGPLGCHAASFSPEHHIEISPIMAGGGGGLIRTVKVQPQIVHHHHSMEEDDDDNGGGFPPVLSIPASFAGLSPTHTGGGGLQISISPISQGADTTSSSMASPRTPMSAGSASSSSQKKSAYPTTKGNKGMSICAELRDSFLFKTFTAHILKSSGGLCTEYYILKIRSHDFFFGGGSTRVLS